MRRQRRCARAVASLFPLAALPAAAAAPLAYPDGRPTASRRMAAEDVGVVLRHGEGPGRCDVNGARDVWVWQDGPTLYMHYDGAGPAGWLACLATSVDGVHWARRGPVLSLGPAGSADAASASYGVTFRDGPAAWHLFYLGTPNTSGPGKIPAFPYQTLEATARSPAGPWTKRPGVTTLRCRPGTYYDCTASPGQVVRQGGGYLMFFSAAAAHPTRRTIGIARARTVDGPWAIDPAPVLPPAEQVENASLYFEPADRTWYLFTNHVGLADNGGEYTDAVWVYWTRDLNRWDPADKAVVVDGRSCRWSHACIGLPSVVGRGDRLALYYDGPGGDGTDHMNRDVGLAYLRLPLRVPRT